VRVGVSVCLPVSVSVSVRVGVSVCLPGRAGRGAVRVCASLSARSTQVRQLEGALAQVRGVAPDAARTQRGLQLIARSIAASDRGVHPHVTVGGGVAAQAEERRRAARQAEQRRHVQELAAVREVRFAAPPAVSHVNRRGARRRRSDGALELTTILPDKKRPTPPTKTPRSTACAPADGACLPTWWQATARAVGRAQLRHRAAITALAEVRADGSLRPPPHPTAGGTPFCTFCCRARATRADQQQC
jgi:hypothetical protein